MIYHIFLHILNFLIEISTRSCIKSMKYTYYFPTLKALIERDTKLYVHTYEKCVLHVDMKAESLQDELSKQSDEFLRRIFILK